MDTYRYELSKDYPELKNAPVGAIGCPHLWGYCDEADTICGKLGSENVLRNHCVCCWDQRMERPKPRRIDYKDEHGNKETICVEGWFIHVYTNKPMCKVRVMREDGSVDFEAITKDEFYRRWALSEDEET